MQFTIARDEIAKLLRATPTLVLEATRESLNDDDRYFGKCIRPVDAAMVEREIRRRDRLHEGFEG